MDLPKLMVHVPNLSALCIAGNFACFFVICLLSAFFLINFLSLKKSSRNTFRMSDSLNTDQTQSEFKLSVNVSEDKSPLGGKSGKS